MSDRIKFEMEFPIKVSQRLLFQYLSTPSGLSEWFADNVNSRGEKFIFIWDDSEEVANLVSKKLPEKIKFQWQDDQDTDYFFELRIQFDEITKDVSLIVTDFAEEDEVEESKMLWTNQVFDLKKVLGSS
ncbi:MAG: START-like domain-containing protein [Bacteroidota bacterium]|nr:START-like domain-containing protein [Bacteroidota bacterium]MEC9107945.1 START-like domain-containing protein [Bacteroidota bacterium]